MNSVVLIGRLTRDPELRYTPSTELAVATFNLAIERITKEGKEKQTDFPRITVFGRQAENCEKFLEKGLLVAVQGRLQTGSYKNKDGATVYTTDVVADRVEFLEWGKKASQDSRDTKDTGDTSYSRDERSTGDSKVETGAPDGFQALEDDDIPF
ncbi:MAG: single-stranded DNA-binding protein [Anaerovoracaceae bacterium]|jgi:single-strand DNA-binding protein|nr:single-stranded DNA-binding protein [Anaerovoracaceae bacterium]